MVTVAGEVAAIEWLGGQVIAAVTKDERIHVIDPFQIVSRQTLRTGRDGQQQPQPCTDSALLSSPAPVKNEQLDSVPVPYLSLIYHKHFPNPESQRQRAAPQLR